MAVVQSFLERNLANAPTKEIGIGAFTALVRTRERYNLSADVPTTPVENGSFVNDHIILKPLTLSIEGDVSDVHLRASPAIRDFARAQAEIGNIASQYAPARTQAQLEKIGTLANSAADAIRQIDNLLATGAQALDYFGNKDGETKTIQEQFLDAMEALHTGKQAFTIEMPYRQHNNMVITSLLISYDNEIDTTTFAMEAQQIQYAELQFAAITTPAPGTGGQLEAKTDKGTQEGEPVEQSLGTQILQGVRATFGGGS